MCLCKVREKRGRDEVRRDEVRRDEVRRDEVRRDEVRRDEVRRAGRGGVGWRKMAKIEMTTDIEFG